MPTYSIRQQDLFDLDLLNDWWPGEVGPEWTAFAGGAMGDDLRP